MKSILIIFCFSLFAAGSFAQFSELEKEFMEFEQTHKDSLTQAMFIDSSFCSKYNLKNVTRNFNRMNIWQNTSADPKDFMRVCDIRWQFKDNLEAVAFHKKFLSVNSEAGEEIKNANIPVANVTELRIFRESEQMRKMNEAFGAAMNSYYFIFVVDNSVAKIFVYTKPNVSAEEASIFAKEAARRLSEYKK